MEGAAHHQWPLAPSWAVNAGFIGKGFILAALILFLYTGLAWAFSHKLPKLVPAAKVAFWIGAICLFGAFITLGALFVNNQFEYSYVFSHGDADTELKYKIAGIWSGQQGSFLLWGCTSSVFGVLAARVAGLYRRWFTVVYAAFLTTLCGILAYETPFEMLRLNGLALQPPQGAGLTPSLQNYWVVIHPPTIFTGFGSLTVAFAFGLAAMFSGNVKDWVAIARPWVLASTAVLGLGLCMGGFWAYETLGWGGFWMWDPVENVSFVPWVFSAALLHGFIVQTTKKHWIGANLALAGLPFILFCYGTFLTRSGFLADASIHSFAEMNKSALWILAIFVGVALLGYISAYVFRGAKLAVAAAPTPAPEAAGVDREAMYSSGVMLLCGLAGTVAVGMSVPFFLALAHRTSKVVEEPLYHLVVVWFFVPIVLLMGIAPFISWRKLSWRSLAGLDRSGSAAVGPNGKSLGPAPALGKVLNVALVTIGVLGLALIWIKLSPAEMQPELGAKVAFPFNGHVPLVPWMLVLMGVCIFCFTSNLWRLIETFKRSKLSVGGFISHMGIAMLLAGLIISRGFEKKDQVELQGGDAAKALGYTITYRGMSHSDEEGVFKRDNKALFDMSSPGANFTARPGLYFMIGNDQKLQTIVWPHVEHMPTYDIYFALHTPVFDVWEQPEMFAPGETRSPGNGPIAITYNGFKMEGQGGAPGTKFVADAIVRITDNQGVTRMHRVHPSIEIAQGGIKPNPDQVDDDFSITMETINAGDHSASFQLHFNEPVFPIDVFYKPMVGLVWLGAAVTCAGGLLAAFYRRPVRKSPPTSEPDSSSGLG